MSAQGGGHMGGVGCTGGCGRYLLHPSAHSVPLGFGAGATSWVCPQSHWCRDLRGSPAGWHSGTLPHLCPAPPSSPPCLRAGSCCHLLATLCPPERRWGQRGSEEAYGEGCWDSGSSPATERGQDEVTAQSRPSSSPPSPQFPQGTQWHPQLYPPVMVAASRCVPVSDQWDTGLVWGQAVTGESGLSWRWQKGGLWLGRVSRGTGVSSLAGVTWGPGLPWGEAPPALAPWSDAGGRQRPFSGPCLGRRICSGDALGTRDTS